MNVTDITNRAGARKRRKRVGRGQSSGTGTTAGRGHKGQQSRSGATTFGLREGGQTPIFRRLPKRGFSNARFRVEYSIVNVGDLDRRFEDGAKVTLQSLLESRLVRAGRKPVKILGGGILSKKFFVEAHKFSSQAEGKINAVGGEVKLIQK